jgi:hypothetical protein
VANASTDFETANSAATAATKWVDCIRNIGQFLLCFTLGQSNSTGNGNNNSIYVDSLFSSIFVLVHSLKGCCMNDDFFFNDDVVFLCNYRLFVLQCI